MVRKSVKTDGQKRSETDRSKSAKTSEKVQIFGPFRFSLFKGVSGDESYLYIMKVESQIALKVGQDDWCA